MIFFIIFLISRPSQTVHSDSSMRISAFMDNQENKALQYYISADGGINCADQDVVQ